MGIALRVATVGDAPQVRDVYAWYIENTEATFNEFVKPLATYAQSIETLVKTYPFLVAEDEAGRFVGFANAEPLRPQSGYYCSVELTIYLCPDAPKHAGIGTALYTKLLDCLKGQGFVNAFAIVNSQNQESLGLHKRFGFKEAAVLPRCAYKHGKWLSAAWLHKSLNPAEGALQPIQPFSEYRKGLKL